MTSYGPYAVHPLADAFPLIEGEEFKELVEDIRENGLRQPIRLTADETTIVDGRNRYRACSEALIDPHFKPIPASFTEEQIADLIVSENLRRRHMDAPQRSRVALRFKEYFAALTKQRQKAAGGGAGRAGGDERTLPQHVAEAFPNAREANAQAGASVGVSREAVRQAQFVRDHAPDLFETMGGDGPSLREAHKQAKVRAAERRKREPEPEKPKPRQAPPVMLTLRTHVGDEVKYPQPASKATFNSTPGAGISWAEWSWNPVTGCLHGCDYCYARETATSDRYAASFPAGFTPLFHHERLPAPTNTRIPAQYRDDSHESCSDGDCKICAYRRVFVCSMADLYGRWVPDEWIEKVHQSMLDAPQWQYITLTKFPARYVGLEMPPGAWVGTSVDEQKRVRIAEDAFRKIEGGAVKWLSLEPLREPLVFEDLSVFDWVVIGAQTATNQPSGHVPAFAPPIEWVSRIIVQALDAGCKVHCKPNLAANPGVQWLNQYPGGES